MDSQGLLPPPIKRRRKHSPSFKKMVVAEANKPGNSIAGVAQRFNVNNNLVHKWRRQFQTEGNGDFVRVAAAINPRLDSDVQTVRVELTSAADVLVLHWPIDQPQELACWIKALS
jgi:transposase-like protein